MTFRTGFKLDYSLLQSFQNVLKWLSEIEQLIELEQRHHLVILRDQP